FTGSSQKTELDLCHKDSITLKVLNAQYFAYQWYKDGVAIKNATDKKLVVKDTGVYTVLVTLDTPSCKKLSDPMTVVSKPLNKLTIALDSSLALCEGIAVPITSVHPAYNSYQWFNGSTPIPAG